MSQVKSKMPKLSLTKETLVNLRVSSAIKTGAGVYWTLSCGRGGCDKGPVIQ